MYSNINECLSMEDLDFDNQQGYSAEYSQLEQYLNDYEVGKKQFQPQQEEVQYQISYSIPIQQDFQEEFISFHPVHDIEAEQNQDEHSSIIDDEIDQPKVYDDKQISTKIIYCGKQSVDSCIHKAIKRKRTSSTGVNSTEEHTVGKKMIKPEQVETKNLAALYARFIIKKMERPTNLSVDATKKLEKAEKKLKNCTLKTLRDLLENQEIKNAAQEYFSNLNFLDDLLRSEKQQDIKTPIKYLHKMYQGCLNVSTLSNWKEQ